MGDTKRVTRKGKERINRIVSLFEIPRPNRSARNLQRTNSLPLNKNLMGTTEGKVLNIRRKIEEKSNEPAPLAPTVSRKHNPTKHILSPKRETDERVNKNLNMKSRIKDVSDEIETGNSELEIIYERVSEGSDDRTSIASILSAFSSGTVQESNGSFTGEGQETDFYASFYGFVTDDWKNSESLQNLDGVESRGKTESTTLESLSDEGEQSPNIAPAKSGFIDLWKTKSFVQINNESVPNPAGSTQVVSDETAMGRFIKNKTRSSMSSRRERRRTGIIKKPFTVSELTRRFEGFKDAAERGETENFRKSVIDEFDKELENMKNDGFNDELYLSLSSDREDTGEFDEDVMGEKEWNKEFGRALRKSIENLKDLDIADTREDRNTSYDENTYFRSLSEESVAQQDDDLFGETYFGEGLESGFVYLEAYNQDDKELVECTVQVDRRSVDEKRFNELRAGSNLLTTNKSRLILLNDCEVESKRNTTYSTTSGESYEADIKLINEDSGIDSKRNTIYSTTSGESDSKRNTICSTTSGDSDDDEDTLEQEEESQNYSAARRETYCDDRGRVRIERVAQYEEKQANCSDYTNTLNQYYERCDEDIQPEAKEDHYYESIERLEHEFMFSTVVKKEKIQYILEEIVSTERKYVADIERVLREYREFLKRKDSTKLEDVFGNLPKIYKLQERFLKGLEEADSNVDLTIDKFIEFRELFALYPIYFKNTPKANAAVKELASLLKDRQEEIGDKLDLSAYLLTPLQRLAKYKLFLENIVKQLTKDGHATEMAETALNMVKKYLRKGNDAVAVSSILLSPIHPRDYGSFISREKFVMTKPKKMDVMVFLFEKVIIFTCEDLKNMEHFVYQTSIKTHDLRIATFENDCLIHLTDFTKTKRRNAGNHTYVLDAKHPKTKESWKTQIEGILWDQMMKLKADSLKRTELPPSTVKKIPRRNNKERSKSTGSSVFYVE